MADVNQDRVWQTLLGEIEVGMSPAKFQTWFKNTAILSVDTTKSVVVVQVPNEFTKSYLEKNFQREIHRGLTKQLGGVSVVQYVVGSRSRLQAPQPTPTTPLFGFDQPTNEPAVVETPTEGLNNKFLFTGFVVGENSRLAYAAAEAVSKGPGTTYNPLFIYGPAGLGKTHLLQAIGNELAAHNPKLRVRYVTSEHFTTEMVEAIRNNQTKTFKDKYRTVDCLLIDDIQFLANKEGTQEEMFHTFNALYNDGRQIVLTSDRPPKAIPGIEERLRSRFEWGLLVDISMPSYETRLAILRTKLADTGREVSEDVLEYIAKTITNNVRELEGALNRVVAYSDLNNIPSTLEDAKNLLGGLFVGAGKRIVRPSEIIRAVTHHFNVSKEEVAGRKRNREIVIPRQILIYLLREEIDMPYKQIGGEIGGRDHTTVMHDYNKIKDLLLTNDAIEQEIRQIKNKLYSSG